ncbi:Bug family tripartite tricarboxylate transporter substrate binding protein [Lacisediminimonas profundi]|uniref:Bug family tripartite tricarboxylate transporter substrate binding protein n=1 Tax=Lacisediminimonas profundi TaxID=2603856 RepID=UPI00124B6F73|nr:tripartite tricarboxylate transporter substrate binding protein [Lacisediminimonas profundi]
MLNFRSLFSLAACSLAAAVGFSGVANAQTWPEKPVKIIVPYPAGGNTDNQARMIAQHMSGVYGQQFVVENKPGANGVIAAEFVANSPADGHTILISAVAQMAIAPAMAKLRYDPVKSFSPISIVGTNALVLAVGKNIPVNNLKEFVEYAKAKNGQLNYASAGNGSVPHLAAVLFFKRAGLTLSHVPYKGGAPAIADVLAGHVPLYFANVAEVLPHAKTGNLKLLAITGDKRVDQLPEVPTIAESGFPGFSVHTWNGLLAPAGTPQKLIDQLAAHVATAAKRPDVIEKMKVIGVTPVGNTPAAFAETIRRDIAMWGEAVRISGASSN